MNRPFWLSQLPAPRKIERDADVYARIAAGGPDAPDAFEEWRRRYDSRQKSDAASSMAAAPRRGDVERAVDAAWTHAWLKRERWPRLAPGEDPWDRFNPWFHTLLRNLARDRQRAIARDDKRLVSLENETAARAPGTTLADTKSALAFRRIENVDLLRDVWGTLSPQQRRTLEALREALRTEGGEAAQQTAAQALCISWGAFRMRLSRIRGTVAAAERGVL